METTEKGRLVSGIRIGDGGVDAQGLRQMAEKNPGQFMQRAQDLIDKGELRWEKVRDVRRLFQALVDVEVPATVEIFGGATRSIMASAFPLLSGGLTVAGINDAYAKVPTIGQELVTEITDPKRFSVYASLQVLTTDKGDDVREGEDYPEIGAGEEKYTIAHKRAGYTISITGEMIDENDVAGIVGKVNALGDIAGKKTEKQTLRRVCDIDGSGSSPAEPYVLHLNGTATQLYNHTANYPGTRAPSGTRVRNNALTDGTDLEAARVVLAAMLDSDSDRIAIPMSQCVLLVPDALASTAFKITNSEYEPGVENEINAWGPRGQYRPRVLSSPRLDDLSTTTWYLGNFKEQFKRKWKLNFEYVTLAGSETEAFLRRRIAFQARVGWDMEVGAVDYVYAVQCLSGTTAP